MKRKILTNSFLSALLGSSIVFSILAPHATNAQTSILQKSLVEAVRAQNNNAQYWLDTAFSNNRSSARQVVLQVNERTSQTTIQTLKENGIELKEYLGDNLFSAIIKPSKTPRNAGQIRSILQVQPAWKITTIPFDLAAKERFDVLINCYPGIIAQEFNDYLKRDGGKLIQSNIAGQSSFIVNVSANELMRLAAEPLVKTISAAANDQPLNQESVAATKTNIAQLPVSAGGYGLDGTDITIGIGDLCSGSTHIDVRDRIIDYNPAPPAGHGTHVNTTAGGAGVLNPAAKGFAPKATLVDQLYANIWALTGTMQQAHQMTVTNNSYAAIVGSCSYAGVYDGYSQILDSVCLQYPDVLHVFASGNDGGKTCTPFATSFATVTGSYQAAKNVITVGNCTKDYVIAGSSSKGPVKDGRLKPEIVSVGTSVFSALQNDVYAAASGTSFSCPQVTGAAGLLQQRYKQLHANVKPPSDLIKTLLLNGALDMGNPGPDFKFGFGVLDLKQSLQMLDSSRYQTGNIATSGVQTYNVTVPANSARLKVMLYWHDVPASVLTSQKLVNDLDLEVVSPSATTTLPLILNSAPASVDVNATNGVDHVNNVEQVVIDSPAAGTYTIRVKGYAVPSGSQHYVVAYDYLPNGITLTSPVAGSVAPANTLLHIYWDASKDTNTFRLLFTDNNGGTWTNVDTAIPASQRFYNWTTTTPGSEQCKFRIIRNTTGEQYATGQFTINAIPALQLAANQCPGYINLVWNTVPGATSYQLLRKHGKDMMVDAVTTDTFYTYRGLSVDTNYYVALLPLINGVAGYRSNAIQRRPNTGNCSGSISDGDLMIEKLIAPVTGRQYTSSALSASSSLSILVRNLDDVAATNYQIAYSLNGGAWQTYLPGISIAANTAQTITVPAGLNLSTPGTYDLRLAVTNLALTDSIKRNDSLHQIVRQLNNAPMNLVTTFNDGFEDLAQLSYSDDQMGVTPNEHWDFHPSNDTGLFRSYVNDDISISGVRSVSLAARQYAFLPVTNLWKGTFNLSGYDTSTDEIRVDFNYKMHGNSSFADSNRLWVRASDTSAWISLYAYNRTGIPGNIEQSGSLSITDALIGTLHNFSSSLQLIFGQKDTTVIATNNYGTGVTLDNVKLYKVTNDLSLDSIIAPKLVLCGLTNTPVTVSITNRSPLAISNILVSYRVDNGTIYTDTIATLSGKANVQHVFNTPVNPLTVGTHSLRSWVAGSGDSYAFNDTATLSIHNQPLITSFPYLENFESNDGYWYSEGLNNSWQYGVPGSLNVNTAASGTKVWKTNLNGFYNDAEQSYLYSPCFDISGLTTPMLSFSAVLDIENCGATLCDAAWIEYSNNGGSTWNKLGASGQGQGWYNNATFQLWNAQGNYRWHVASIPLPASAQPIRLRFVLKSDGGTGTEGISLDDIHVYDLSHDIYNASSIGPVSHSVSGSSFTDFLSSNNFICQINPLGQNIGNTDASIYLRPAPISQGTRYYLSRSFTVASATTPPDSILARFYVTDAEVLSLLNATSCPGCSKPADVYRLGIYKYHDAVTANENDILADDTTGTVSFYPATSIKWVPYNAGYYAELKLPSFSEIWFTDGLDPQPLPLHLLDFTLRKNARTVDLNWKLAQVDKGDRIELQRSGDGKTFSALHTTVAQQTVTNSSDSYTDKAPLTGKNYYRLSITNNAGGTSYSRVLLADFDAMDDQVTVYPNPAKTAITINWPTGNEPASIQLINAFGQKIYNQERISSNHFEVPVQTIANGIYFLRFEQGEVIKHFQVQIIH